MEKNIYNKEEITTLEQVSKRIDDIFVQLEENVEDYDSVATFIYNVQNYDFKMYLIQEVQKHLKMVELNTSLSGLMRLVHDYEIEEKEKGNETHAFKFLSDELIRHLEEWEENEKEG